MLGSLPGAGSYTLKHMMAVHYLSPAFSRVSAVMGRHRRTIVRGFLLLCFCLVLPGVLPVAGYAATPEAPVTVVHADYSRSVLTYHNDLPRSGQYLMETKLNTKTVSADTFGKIASFPVDGELYSQPLYVTRVAVPLAGTHKVTYHNLTFVTTEHDSVYAFDTDTLQNTTPLWCISFISQPSDANCVSVAAVDTTATTIPTADLNCGDLSPEVGITGTPVIDPSTGTLYVVARTKETPVGGGNTTYVQRLHALNIATGGERTEFNSPMNITATIQGTGNGSSGGQIPFDTLKENQRAALLLFKGTVYISWASHCDNGPYHGWILGYNTRTLQQNIVYNVSPNDSPGDKGSGIWMSGGGPAVDSSGNIYVITGNGAFDLDQTGGTEAGNTFLKLKPDGKGGLAIADSFTPFDQSCLDGRDADLGSSAPLLLPNQSGKLKHLLIGVGKQGRLYLVNRDNMGKFTSIANPCDPSQESRTDVDKIVQTLPESTLNSAPSVRGMFGTIGYWKGTAKSGLLLYLGVYDNPLKAFRLQKGLLVPTPISQTPESFGFSGPIPSISANGSRTGSGIVWVINPASCPLGPGCQPNGSGALQAYDATDLSHELYSSRTNDSRDQLTSYVKFSVPTIANGKVMVGSNNTLYIYGLLPKP